MELHIHKFQNIGGGCLKGGDPKTMCDDHYKCQCGAEFILRTSLEGHTYLPKTILADKADPIKIAELKAIDEMLNQEPLPPPRT